MISYDKALRQVLDNVPRLQPQQVSLPEAAGLVLAAPARACWDMPAYDNAAMDGYAVAGAGTTWPGPLEIVGASYAGHPFTGDVPRGGVARITTGALLPQGTDTVIPLEEVEEKDGKIFPVRTPHVGQHVRNRGEEYRGKEILVGKGEMLRAGEIALLASAGVELVKVYPRPRVAVVSTGDELVELGREPRPGQIINSNFHLLRTRLRECGCTLVSMGIGADHPVSLEEKIDQAFGADLIVSTGGVSVGDKDYVQTALEKRHFQKLFWRVAIKPGKPLLFGLIEKTPYFGLPGNPAATAATFELFVKPALKRLAGRQDVMPDKRRAVLADEVVAGGSRQLFLWCRLEWQYSGYQVTVSRHQGSGQNRCLSSTNAILPVPVGTETLQPGDDVEVFLI